MTIKKIADTLNVSADEVEKAVEELTQTLSGRGISIMRNEKEVELRTSAEASALIEKITKEEISKDLGKAGLETLSIVLYKGPVKRSEIDYIRGVSSQYILRSLLVRGLVQREVDPTDARTVVYSPTMDLLGMLGVKSAKELPDYAAVQEEWKKQTDNLAETAPTETQNPTT